MKFKREKSCQPKDNKSEKKGVSKILSAHNYYFLGGGNADLTDLGTVTAFAFAFAAFFFAVLISFVGGLHLGQGFFP